MTDSNEEYEQAIQSMRGLDLPLEGLIRILLEGRGVRVHDITSRVKSKASVIRKLQRSDKKREIGDLTDLLGIRVITYFPDDVDEVANLVEQEFEVDTENSVDKRAVLDPDRFGYLSLHYVLKLSKSRLTLPEYSGYKNVKFELQIRSILQHAWAEIEHDLGYKSKVAVPATVKRRFSRLAGLLELVDAEFLEIRTQLARINSSSPSHLDEVDSEIERLLGRLAPIALPVWPQDWAEDQYNLNAAHFDPRFVVLDRAMVPIPFSDGRFEACDLLGPNDELIHVKRARNSVTLGHLFNQALVSTEILLRFAEARLSLADVVSNQGVGRQLSPNFLPREVVLALPSRAAPRVAMDEIPPLARITLARVARALEDLGVTLHILGIESVSSLS